MKMIDELYAIEEIKKLKARYFRYMDNGQWDQLALVFAENAYFDATDAVRNGCKDDSLDQKMGVEWINEGRENIINFISSSMQGTVSAHHGHMPEITITSESTAEGIWPMSDTVRKYENGKQVMFLEGAGYYTETYEKIDGSWCIKTSTLTRIRAVVEEN